ncbi:hypothetical protein BH11PSE10_BH11PSE10_13630 [soil metagenome]
MRAGEPAQLQLWLPRGLAVLAAALFGLGLVMWVAANWDDFGRPGRFALLQAALLVGALTAAAKPPWRAPAALLALLATGTLFAYFGQTYQTGADTWQLFALWATLSLPLAWAAHSDVVWAPWAVVATMAVAFWVQTHTGHRWRVEAGDLAVHVTGFGLLLMLCVSLSQPLARWTGAGLWAWRTAALLAVAVLLVAALGGLFSSPVRPQYALGSVVLAVAAGVSAAHRRFFDVFVLSAVALGLDTLLVAGLARWLFDGRSRGGDPIMELLLIGGAAAVLLALSVQQVMRLARRSADEVPL